MSFFKKCVLIYSTRVGFCFFFAWLRPPGACDCNWRRSFPNVCLQHMLNWAKFSTGLVCLTHSLKICAVGEEKDFSQRVFQLLLLWVIPAVMGDPCRCGNCGAKGGARWGAAEGELKAPSVQIQIQCFRSRAEWVLFRSILSWYDGG